MRQLNSCSHGNNNSLLMLNNLLETAQVAKKIKDTLESELPKNASRFKIIMLKFAHERYIWSMSCVFLRLISFLTKNVLSNIV
mgnify:FL=1